MEIVQNKHLLSSAVDDQLLLLLRAFLGDASTDYVDGMYYVVLMRLSSCTFETKAASKFW
jgi:hypothetical protein